MKKYIRVRFFTDLCNTKVGYLNKEGETTPVFEFKETQMKLSSYKLISFADQIHIPLYSIQYKDKPVFFIEAVAFDAVFSYMKDRDPSFKMSDFRMFIGKYAESCIV